jgi:hypothetical protein
MDGNRRASRRRVLKNAMIEFDRGAYSCAVRNLSGVGAAAPEKPAGGSRRIGGVKLTAERGKKLVRSGCVR